MKPSKRTLALAILAALAAPAVLAQPVADPAADPAAEAEAEARELETISVIGEGETRQVQTLSYQDLRVLPAGTSPLKMLAKLPGVNFQAADPWGAYEWSARLGIRGFNQNQLGFTLDGVPLGDMSYGNFNGLHISRAVISENLGRAELAQGSGSVGAASTNNLGGTVEFFSADPLPDFASRAGLTVGSDSARRAYGRLDTGINEGFGMYVSAVYSDADKWKGFGPQEQTQFNGKFTWDIDALRLTGYVATSRRDETDYADLSLESAERLGYDWDNYAQDWQRAIAAARGQFTGGVETLDDAYYIARGLRDDDLAYVSLDVPFGDAVTLAGTAYIHTNEGQGHWATPYAPSSPTLPISLRTTEYDIERIGSLGRVTWEFGINRIEAGFWYETNTHGLQRNFYFLNIDNPPDEGFFYRNPDVRVFRQRFDVDTRQLYLTDRITLADGNVLVDLGFKAIDVDVEARSIIGSRAGGELETKDNFVPQAGVRWKFTDEAEVFASYAENLGALRAGVSGPFATSQSAFDRFADTLEPESSRTLEAGLRWVGDTLEASAAVYSVDFDDRLLGIARCAGIVGCAGAFANVGEVRSTGAEFAVQWQVTDDFSLYNSLSYNDSEYRSDYLDGETLIPADGKQVVDAPKVLFASEATYRLGAFDFRLGVKYTDERYVTYLNDSKVDDFWVVDGTIGYDFGQVGFTESLRAQFNVSNLFDEEYFATVGSNGFVTSDPDGLNYTLLTGAPRQVFLTLDATF
jgi:iron complex outermembrane receptor protein